MYISGHVHVYERLLPIYDGKLAPFDHDKSDTNYNYIRNPQAPVYVLEGKPGHHNTGEERHPYKPGPLSAVVDGDWSVARVTAHNNTHLYLE